MVVQQIYFNSHMKTNWDKKNFIFHFWYNPASSQFGDKYSKTRCMCSSQRRMDGMFVSRCVFLLMFWNQYLDSRMSLFIFRIIGFVMLLLCQCIFDNKSLTKTAFPLLFAHFLAVPSGGTNSVSVWYLWSRVYQQNVVQGITPHPPACSFSHTFCVF